MPLLIAGNGEKRALRIVARFADIWNGEGMPDDYARRNGVLDRWCADVGRDPTSIRRTVGIPPVMIRATRAAAVDALAATLGRYGGGDDRARGWAASSPLADTAAVVAGHLRGWRAAGAEEVVIDQPSPLDDETMDRLAGFAREGGMTRPRGEPRPAVDLERGWMRPSTPPDRRSPGACCRLRG